MTTRWASFGMVLAFGAAAACVPGVHDEHGHEHGGGHEEAEEAPPLAITRWTDRHELFVEFPQPIAGKPVPYHAHVTRLDGFAAVTEGVFHVRFRSASAVAAEAHIQGVKRPGIFVPEGLAPAEGTYSLEMTYEHGGATDVFDCGPIRVVGAPLAPEPEAPSSAITFLKESQWKIPFGTAWAEERPIARELEVPATVEPAAGDRLTVAAPTGGRFFHNPKLALAEGGVVAKGDILGFVAPTIAGEDYSRLLQGADEARLEVERLERELARVEPLVKQGLLPERRRLDLRSELDAASARRRGAQGRVGNVTAPGGAGGLPIRASVGGLLSEVLVPNGEPVSAGAPLVRLGGTESLWLRARFIAKPAASYAGAAPASVRLANGERLELGEGRGRLLSTQPVVDPSSRIATWIVEVPRRAGTPLGSADLRPGASVVLSLRLGEAHPALSVPREAVIDINTRSYVFVQVDGEHFEKRAVSLGDGDGAFVALTAGVAKGERVVTRGGFDVHLASLVGVVESHRH